MDAASKTHCKKKNRKGAQETLNSLHPYDVIQRTAAEEIVYSIGDRTGQIRLAIFNEPEVFG